jgi:hypothetical protein
MILTQGWVSHLVQHKDDEWELSFRIPKSLNKHCVAVGYAIASHYSYHPQLEILNKKPKVMNWYREIARNETMSEELKVYLRDNDEKEG